MKDILKTAWPEFARLILVLSIFSFAIGLCIAFSPEKVEGIPANLPIYLRVLVGTGGVAIHAAAYLHYYRAIGIIGRK